MLEETKKILSDIGVTSDEITSKEQAIYELQKEIDTERLRLGNSLEELKDSGWLVEWLGGDWTIDDEDLIVYLEDMRGISWDLEEKIDG